MAELLAELKAAHEKMVLEQKIAEAEAEAEGRACRVTSTRMIQRVSDMCVIPPSTAAEPMMAYVPRRRASTMGSTGTLLSAARGHGWTSRCRSSTASTYRNRSSLASSRSAMMV